MDAALRAHPGQTLSFASSGMIVSSLKLAGAVGSKGTCMAALESPPAAQKSVTGSRPRACAPREAWKARMTPASEAGSSPGQARPATAASAVRLSDCGSTAATAGSTSGSERDPLPPRASAGATPDAVPMPGLALVTATAAPEGEGLTRCSHRSSFRRLRCSLPEEDSGSCDTQCMRDGKAALVRRSLQCCMSSRDICASGTLLLPLLESSTKACSWLPAQGTSIPLTSLACSDSLC